MRFHVLVIVALASVICSVGTGLAADGGFDTAPPTRGIERNTAHTLHAKELQIGFLFSEALQDAYVEVGVSDSLQLGLAMLTTLGGQPYGWLSTSGQIGDKLLMGTFTGFRFRPGSWSRPNYLYGQIRCLHSLGWKRGLGSVANADTPYVVVTNLPGA